MQRNETLLEAERLVNLHQTVRTSAQVVYEITEKLIDALPDDERNPAADIYVDIAYDELRKADRLNEMGRNLLSLKAYPTYSPNRRFRANLKNRSDEQQTRLDHHLRFVCLRDTGDLLPRKEAAEAVIDGMLFIHNSRDMIFFDLERSDITHELSNNQIRVLEGVIEMSIDYVETIAGVVRKSTQIAP